MGHACLVRFDHWVWSLGERSRLMRLGWALRAPDVAPEAMGEDQNI